ncbi:MAG: formimidoylglutamase [Cyclobacteriaceae bacterium]
MAFYSPPDKELWKGRLSEESLYIYQRIQFHDLGEALPVSNTDKSIVLLGYQSDEGVRRNHGRIGTKEGADAVRKALGSFADHCEDGAQLFDIGNVVCDDENLEDAHELIEEKVKQVLDQNDFPILLGGGHDLAYPHFRGIKNHFIQKGKKSKIGIINLDAHFDLRKPNPQRNSGTPFYQISEEPVDFNYLCLGIQTQANNKQLYQTAESLNVDYIEIEEFRSDNWQQVEVVIQTFISKVDHIYLTIDLDGFSSAYAPGVSAPSPLGFDPTLALAAMRLIVESGKLISADIVELNPSFDRDDQTAKLGARLVSQLINNV